MVEYIELPLVSIRDIRLSFQASITWSSLPDTCTKEMVILVPVLSLKLYSESFGSSEVFRVFVGSLDDAFNAQEKYSSPCEQVIASLPTTRVTAFETHLSRPMLIILGRCWLNEEEVK